MDATDVSPSRIEKAKYDTEGITPDLSDEAYNQYIAKRIAEDKDGIVVDLQIEAVNEKIKTWEIYYI